MEHQGRRGESLGSAVTPPRRPRVILCDEWEKPVAVDVDALYRKYGPMVLRRCRSLLGDEEEALDAMQDTFVKVLRYRERLTDEAPSSLLYCMATNICLNKMRSERRRPRPSSDEVLQTIASAEDVESLALARHAIEGIFAGERASTRTMAVLHYVDGMTLEEVARTAGLSVSGVRKRLRTLRTRTRALEVV
jgi:RNA polymerase sigma-70 factor (ECF subfamily)